MQAPGSTLHCILESGAPHEQGKDKAKGREKHSWVCAHFWSSPTPSISVSEVTENSFLSPEEE